MLNHTTWTRFQAAVLSVEVKVVCSSKFKKHFSWYWFGQKSQLLIVGVSFVQSRETWTWGVVVSIHNFQTRFSSLKKASKHTIIKQFWVWVTYGPSESFSYSGIVLWILRSSVVRCAESITPSDSGCILRYLCLKYCCHLSSLFLPCHNHLSHLSKMLYLCTLPCS